ncbi:MAG: thymidine phosphorylase [Christensenellales bacterium]|jgi:pyrimidine-nucleoside phosphorylase
MHMTDLIIKKRDGGFLSEEEIRFFTEGYSRKAIPDYQAAALLMAICIRGMSEEETLFLTQAMAFSGETLDLSGIDGVVADKHSTGGVGDTTTLVVVPLVAACGLHVAKMSGAGLGHTGGTIDKLESIPGLRTALPVARFLEIVREVGCSVVSQNLNLAPADKMLYALRDVTGTVESLPLIASSIMSKKLALGCDALVLDVKTGAGALLTKVEQAFALAEQMMRIGERAGIRTRAVVTDMTQPLGCNIGNALEVAEAVEILKGMHEGSRLYQVCMLLAQQMLLCARVTEDAYEAEDMLKKALHEEKALETFKRMVAAQGGDVAYIEDEGRLYARAARRYSLETAQGGVLAALNARTVGLASQRLGAGRESLQDAVDYGAGICMKKQVGDAVKPGDELAVFYYDGEEKLQEAVRLYQSAVTIGKASADTTLVHGILAP